MKKIRSTVALSLLAVASGSLMSCGSHGDVLFWSSFGATYKGVLNNICDDIMDDVDFTIEHESKGSYPEIRKAMTLAIADGSYPNIAMGYPDHFAEYLGSDALMPLDSYVTEEIKADYYGQYLTENYFIDSYGEEHLYGIPFNKSTELLGYNGTFVDYCEEKEPGLGTLPKTWQKWAEMAPRYMAHYEELMGKCLYGKQDVDGSTHDFVVRDSLINEKNEDGEYVDDAGNLLLMNLLDIKKETSRLISWDATDNAFITLIRQWGATYTEIPEDQKYIHPFYKAGKVVFGSEANVDKVVDCLKFFKRLNNNKLFGIPAELEGSFSSDAFSNGNVMFMVCSSGGLSYNTKAPWTYRFRVAPIPYYDDGVDVRKKVISQGANICMTDAGNYDMSWEAINQLTRGDHQADWCLQTGYFPSSVSATKSEKYQAFLHEADGEKTQAELEQIYSKHTRCVYREASVVNDTEYMKEESNPWDKFVDPAFIGSATIRDVVAGCFLKVFNLDDSKTEDSSVYYSVIRELLNNESIKDHPNIQFDKSSKVK